MLSAPPRWMLPVLLAIIAMTLFAAGCSSGDDSGEDAANDVSAGICAEGAEDCDDSADENGDSARGPTAAASPEPCDNPASCEEQSTIIARRDLASQLGVEVDAITVVSAEAVDWPDACLGAAKPGTVCAQVITPGFKIVLENDGKQYEYHTNNGTRAVLTS